LDVNKKRRTPLTGGTKSTRVKSRGNLPPKSNKQKKGRGRRVQRAKDSGGAKREPHSGKDS